VSLTRPGKDSQSRVLEAEKRNEDIQNAFKQKAKALTDITKRYEVLKGEKMAAQTMNAASDEAEQMVQGMAAGNRFSGHYNPVVGNAFRRPISGSSGGVPEQAKLREMHSMQGHSQQDRMQSRGYLARRFLFLCPFSDLTVNRRSTYGQYFVHGTALSKTDPRYTGDHKPRTTWDDSRRHRWPVSTASRQYLCQQLCPPAQQRIRHECWS
jgi:hypothetical protein